MPTTDRKLRVFLCHSSQDKPIVRELYQRLNAEGWIDPWLDEEKLLPGMNWDMEIEKAVEVADAVIVCLSNNSVTKEGYVQKELRTIIEKEWEKPEDIIFIIPLRLDDCPYPRRLKDFHYQDYFKNIDQAYKRLYASLEKRAETVEIDVLETKDYLRVQEQERVRREWEDKIRKEAEEKIRREEGDKIRQKIEEAVRKAYERKLRKQAIEKFRREQEERDREGAENTTIKMAYEFVEKTKRKVFSNSPEEMIRQKQIQAILFDLDDTLVHITPVILTEICKRISEIKKTPVSVDDYTIVFLDVWNSRSNLKDAMRFKNIKHNAFESERQYWKNFFENLLPSIGMSPYQSGLVEWLIDIYTNPHSFNCFDDVYPTLSELQRKGLVLGIISNAFPSADRILDYLNLRRYFKYIFLSFELPYAKPEVEIYKFATEKVNLRIEDILFIDDQWIFVKGAQEANMNALLIERETETPREIHTTSLVRRIRSLEELLSMSELLQYKSQISHIESDQNFCSLPIATVSTRHVAMMKQ